MKAIMISIRPEWVAKILNGEKTIEIRKRFPKDYVGWVYIYCTRTYFVHKNKGKMFPVKHISYSNEISFLPKRFENVDHPLYYDLRGKVIARFWCDNVEEIKYHFGYYDMGGWTESYILENSCLSAKELDDYLQASKEYDETKVSKIYGYAIHITKVEPFDKSKEIKEFRKPNTFSLEQLREFGLPYNEEMYKDMAAKGKWFLTRAPQSWYYIEV